MNGSENIKIENKKKKQEFIEQIISPSTPTQPPHGMEHKNMNTTEYMNMAPTLSLIASARAIKHNSKVPWIKKKKLAHFMATNQFIFSFI